MPELPKAELDDSGYDTTRKSVLWVSSLIIIESFLGIHLSEIPHLESVKDWKLSVVFIVVIGYFTFRLMQYSFNEFKFEGTSDILKDRLEDNIKQAESRIKELLLREFKYINDESHIYIQDGPKIVNFDLNSVYDTYFASGTIHYDSRIGQTSMPRSQEFEKSVDILKAVKIGTLKNTKKRTNLLLPHYLHVRLPFIISGIAMIVLIFKFLISLDAFPYQVSGPTFQHPVWAQPKP